MRHVAVEELDDEPKDSEQPAVSDEWMQVVRRRSAEYDAGGVETVTWDDELARWQKRNAVNG